MISSTVTDFLVIGDVRSLVWEAAKWWRNEPHDDFIVALASIGLLSTALTYGSGGTAAPAKGSLSLLKVAKEANKISAPLQKSLIRVFKEAERTRSLKRLRPISDAIYQLARTPNIKMRDFLTIISRSDNVSDLRLMPKVAKAYGRKTGKLLSLGGDDSLRIFRKFGNHKEIANALDTRSQIRTGRNTVAWKSGTESIPEIRYADQICGAHDSKRLAGASYFRAYLVGCKDPGNRNMDTGCVEWAGCGLADILSYQAGDEVFCLKIHWRRGPGARLIFPPHHPSIFNRFRRLLSSFDR